MLNRETELILTRINETRKQTQGLLEVAKTGNKYSTIELPWKENKQNISCIPKGYYPVTKRYSSKYGYHLHIKNVPGRDFILIHAGNYYTQTRGCILVGLEFRDINSDQEVDVVRSQKALGELLTQLPKQFNIIIK